MLQTPLLTAPCQAYSIHELSTLGRDVVGLPMHVWLDMPRKVRSVGEHEMKFTDDPLA